MLNICLINKDENLLILLALLFALVATRACINLVKLDAENALNFLVLPIFILRYNLT